MDDYDIEKVIGEGVYSKVWQAKCLRTNERVAIKVLKDEKDSSTSRDVGEKMIFHDLFNLGKTSHPNVVRMRDLIIANDTIHFVFDFMPQNLRQLIEIAATTSPFSDGEVRKVTKQILMGLQYIHDRGFFHRDLKPENILCDGIRSVKVGDLGQARRMQSLPPYTCCVATCWYRAPELLTCSGPYSSPVDIWAVGCIMGELYNLQPLFRGNCDIDQLSRVAEVLGTPPPNASGCMQVGSSKFAWLPRKAMDLRSVLATASDAGLQVLRRMLAWSPQARPNVRECLRHDAFLRADFLLRECWRSCVPAVDQQVDYMAFLSSSPVLRAEENFQLVYLAPSPISSRATPQTRKVWEDRADRNEVRLLEKENAFRSDSVNDWRKSVLFAHKSTVKSSVTSDKKERNDGTRTCPPSALTLEDVSPSDVKESPAAQAKQIEALMRKRKAEEDKSTSIPFVAPSPFRRALQDKKLFLQRDNNHATVLKKRGTPAASKSTIRKDKQGKLCSRSMTYSGFLRRAEVTSRKGTRAANVPRLPWIPAGRCTLFSSVISRSSLNSRGKPWGQQ